MKPYRLVPMNAIPGGRICSPIDAAYLWVIGIAEVGAHPIPHLDDPLMPRYPNRD